MLVKENIYVLAMAYGLAKRQLALYKSNKNRYYADIYKGIVYSFEERFRDLNEDLDVLGYFGVNDEAENSMAVVEDRQDIGKERPQEAPTTA